MKRLSRVDKLDNLDVLSPKIGVYFRSNETSAYGSNIFPFLTIFRVKVF